MKIDQQILLHENESFTVEGREQGLFQLRLNSPRSLHQMLEDIGHIPLPPYIKRADTIDDQTRYQTVFACEPGAVAAPTAGLHFDQALLDKLQIKGINTAYITLHVGAGTFQSMRVDKLSEHSMHSERIEVGNQVIEQIRTTKAQGGRVFAVGTTVIRALETASLSGELQPYNGETDLFITPGFQFNCIDCLITNFHVPESTLLVLVCAFGGYSQLMAAYQHAISHAYRFFSYGDAMLIERS
jgi:S-adenosylmethionine:tRNA ribosyltransferase-isomerase